MSRSSTPKAVTRNDVARLAGVSSAVVSYVINDGPRPVAEATRAKVLAAIDKLGYRPNAAARTLITGRSDLIGLIVPDVRNQYFAALAQAVEVAARDRGVNVVLTQGTTGRLLPLVEALSGHQVAGIITATLPEPEATASLVRHRVQLVRLSLAQPSTEAIAFWPDYYGGARCAVQHLIEVHGHQRIALVIGSDHPEAVGEPMDDRERGWRDALAAAGLIAERRITAHWSSAGGRDAAKQLLERYPDSTAVFVSSDQQSIGLLAGLHRAGRTVPADLAVASFDGSPEAEFTIPPLTTSSVPMAAMAADAVARLLDGVDGVGGVGGVGGGQAHPTKLTVRHSCGC